MKARQRSRVSSLQVVGWFGLWVFGSLFLFVMAEEVYAWGLSYVG
ncbi:MAG: hypothetical protein SNJ60_01260 [Pseudanabaenaceae cyanobacterium]|jgi:hypothetical protein